MNLKNLGLFLIMTSIIIVPVALVIHYLKGVVLHVASFNKTSYNELD